MLSSEASFGVVTADGSRDFAFDPRPTEGATALLEYPDETDEGGVGAMFGDVRLPTVVKFADDEFVVELGACDGGCGGGTDGTDGDEIIDAPSPLKNSSRFAWIWKKKREETSENVSSKIALYQRDIARVLGKIFS